MTVKNAAGETLTKAQVEALRTTVTHDDTYTFAAPLYVTTKMPGENRTTNYESGLQKAIAPNIEYTQAQIDALFDEDGTDAPTIRTVTPATGPAAGGTNVTIDGEMLEGVKSVTFGGVAATNVTVVNDTTVTCTTPAHAAGAVNVVAVDDVVGNLTLLNGFTYQ